MSVTRTFLTITRADIAAMQEEVICRRVLETGAKIILIRRHSANQRQGLTSIDQSESASSSSEYREEAKLEIVPLLLSHLADDTWGHCMMSDINQSEAGILGY